ncbi:MAG: hypothetical protein HUJ25_04910 [Crocinitomicaceae bacterium]|nr:hypothetical protein [Crocinitomicaceae bacterium]
MKQVILTILFCLPYFCISQHVDVLKYNDQYERYRKSRYFDYVHEDFDSANLTWVADLRVEFDTVLRGMIGESYKELKEKANQFGANGFKVNASNIYKSGKDKYIEISVYWIRMENRNENLELFKDNKVYLFGFLGYHQDIDGYDVEIQDESFIMRALTYREYSYPPKTDVTLALGSKIRGTEISFKMEERMFPKFFYFNMIKGSFKNAWIDEYSLSFGTFLTQILEKD